MSKSNIEKYSLSYSVIRGIAKLWHDKVYNRRVIAIGKENFSKDTHNILVGNHQNALMDALAIIFTSPGQPIFLTRASAFKNKFISKILFHYKMLPVFRPRDGWETVKQNDDIFLKTIDVIKNKNGLGVMPEGNHAGYRRLRQLQKGVCRIAFQTEESENFSLDIQIVPIAVEYSHYFKFRQVVTVTYGKPFGFKELHELYKEKPQIALNALRDKIYNRLKEIMIHIESVDDYEAIDELRGIVNGKYNTDTVNPKVVRDKKLIGQLEIAEEKNNALYREICNKSLKIKNISESLNIGYYHLDRKNSGLIAHSLCTLGMIVLAPIALFGFITNLVFYRIPNLALKNIKDEQFLSTIRFAVSLVLAILFIPIYTILAFIFIPKWWIALLLLLSILPTGWLAWNYFLIWKKLRESVRVRKYRNRKNPEYKIITSLYRDLLKDLEKLNH